MDSLPGGFQKNSQLQQELYDMINKQIKKVQLTTGEVKPENKTVNPKIKDRRSIKKAFDYETRASE